MGLSGNDNEHQRLESLSRYDILDTPNDPAFDDLATLAAQFCNAPISLISFLDRDREWFKSKVGTSVREIPRDVAFASRAIGRGEFLSVPDATFDEDLRENPFVKNEPHARFFAGCPLVDSHGVPLGAIYVLDHELHELNAQQQQMLRILGHEAIMLLELRREIRENRQRNEKTLSELSKMKARLDAESAQHRHIEDELKRREQQLADAQRITHLGSWEWDLRANTISWSDELYRIYGLQPNQFEATYAAYLRYVHPDDRAKTNQAVEHALVTKGSFRHEERIVRADGAVRTLFSSGEVICDDQGQPVRMVGCCHDITERKKTENKLQDSLSLLNATLDSTADGILVVDSNQRIVQFNRKFAELWHLPPEFVSLYDDQRLLGMTAEQLKDPETFLEKVEKLYCSPEAEDFDVLEFKDGRTFERYSCPQRLGKEVVGRVWSFRDVTERTRALKILRQSEERYRSLVAATAQVVWITDPNGELIEDSSSWRNFTGQTFPQIKNRGWLNAVHPRDRARVAELWDHAPTSGSIYHSELRVQRADGEWRDVLARGVPVSSHDGTIREWIGSCVDITERKQATEIIRKERDFSNALISSLPGIFYLLDETGLNLRWNQNLEKLTGYSAEEIVKMRAIDFVPEEEKALVAKRVHKVFTNGEANVELNLLTKSGKLLPFYCTGKLVNGETGPCLIGCGVDISALKKAEAEIKRLNTELEERVKERTAQLKNANKELGSFTYTASHDLRSPIRAIVAFARAIREDGASQLDAENRNYLDRIIRAGDRMLQLIDDLLHYCSVGKHAVYLQPLSLSALVKETLQEFEPRLTKFGGQVSIAPDLPAVLGDPTLLRQIVSNLLENALTYRKKETPLRLEITSRDQAGHAVFCIGDNGIGIAPEHQKRIFEVFERLHRDEDFPGTGIGLATVKKAAEKLGGEVWVESEVGKGSIFCVRLKSFDVAGQQTRLP